MVSEEDKKGLLQFIDAFREAVVNATALEGKWIVNRPSLQPVWRDMVTPAGWTGNNHVRYTCTIDILKPQSLTSRMIEEETV